LELVAAINAMLGTRIEPEFAPPRAGDVKHSLADIALARADLGFAPAVSLEEGLRRCLEYHRGRQTGGVGR
jgi:UDP-glucose 4-epimerase